MDNQEGPSDKCQEECAGSARRSRAKSRSSSHSRCSQSPQGHQSSITGVTDGRPDGQPGQGGASLNTNNSNNNPNVQSVNNNSSFHCTKFGLTCLSTNADNLRNKLAELNHIISIHNPDIIAVQEVFPKNSEVQPDKVTYETNGYELFLGNNMEKRGVALYIKDDIKANEILLLTSYEEAVWCEIKLKGKDKLIVGSVYRSPNSGQDNNTELANMLKDIAKEHASHLLIMGDLNFPRIDWINETSPASLDDPNTCFLELVRDNFLHQHIKENTHFRPGCQPSCIDLVFTNEEGMVSAVEHLAPIGASHHQMLKFKFNCYYIHETKTRVSYKYDKGDYAKLREELSNIQWNDILADKNTEEMWSIIEGKLIDSMDKCIPKSKPNNKRSVKKPLWMDKKALIKVKKKSASFQRYLQTKEGKDYDTYAKYRNQAK